MTDIKGPTVDPEAFRVEGHCCGIRLPVLKELTGEGIRSELTPETKAELVKADVLRADDDSESPKRRLDEMDETLANLLPATWSEACFVPPLARIDDADDQQHDRHLDQHPDDGGERGA